MKPTSIMEFDGWTHAVYPMPDGERISMFMWEVRDQYPEEDYEIDRIMSYSNANFNPLTCDYRIVHDIRLRPKAEYGVEIVYRKRVMGEDSDGRMSNRST